MHHLFLVCDLFWIFHLNEGFWTSCSWILPWGLKFLNVHCFAYLQCIPHWPMFDSSSISFFVCSKSNRFNISFAKSLWTFRKQYSKFEHELWFKLYICKSQPLSATLALSVLEEINYWSNTLRKFIELNKDTISCWIAIGRKMKVLSNNK